MSGTKRPFGVQSNKTRIGSATARYVFQLLVNDALYLRYSVNLTRRCPDGINQIFMFEQSNLPQDALLPFFAVVKKWLRQPEKKKGLRYLNY